MPALLVICGLGGPESGYGRFFDLLRNRSHARLSPAVWAVETAESPKNLVITSYSIHYTKLYDNNALR